MVITDLPRLLQAVYARSNYLRKEILLAINTSRLYPNRKAQMAAFFAAVLTEVNAELGTSAQAALPATSAVVTNGQVITISGFTYTFTVAGGVVTNIVKAAV
jgi:hypothetical protein